MSVDLYLIFNDDVADLFYLVFRLRTARLQVDDFVHHILEAEAMGQ
jgi:hypothetical protein